VVHAETLSMAMLVVLETLSPLERAVFILREVFGYGHAEIADTVGRSEVAVRQLAARARRHVDARRPRFETDPSTLRDVAERFMVASREGDVDALMRLLAPEVEFVADGGGLARAPLRPVHGAERVTRFLLAAGGRMTADQRMGILDLNGSPAIVSWAGDAMIAAATLEVENGCVRRILLVANPEKLGALRPL
jgi:RNA polymerase sigma-70 factor, ECF subfamily